MCAHVCMHTRDFEVAIQLSSFGLESMPFAWIWGSQSLRWPLCFNICSGVCSCSEPSANFHLCCPRCILKFFSLCISWKPESGWFVYKRKERYPFPHPLFVLNTMVWFCFVFFFNKTVWTSKCLYGLVREFYFPVWIKNLYALPKQSAMLSL